jgi:hypothetical protein|tara:strand:+ start:121 stop:261 length:141 start_codon:yes stop_codon:yes gene_type:complete
MPRPHSTRAASFDERREMLLRGVPAGVDAADGTFDDAFEVDKEMRR